MKRRDLIALLGSVAVAAPLAARAQQKAMPVIGFLSGISRGSYAPFVAAFHAGLGETGYVEGQNVGIEYRWAEGRYDRLPALAADLVARNVDVIATSGGAPSALAAKGATAMIPIAFLSGDDPVAIGLIASLARPGGNLTGISLLAVDLHPKRLELLSELVPQARSIMLLVNPANENSDRITQEVQEAARTRQAEVSVVMVGTEGELYAAFGTLDRSRADVLIVGSDPFFVSSRDQLVSLAAHRGMPAIYFDREFAAIGGLVSYGASLTGVYRRLGTYTGRILRGEKPAQMPVEQPTKFELVINLKTAKALGLTVPQSLLARADEVIE